MDFFPSFPSPIFHFLALAPVFKREKQWKSHSSVFFCSQTPWKHLLHRLRRDLYLSPVIGDSPTTALCLENLYSDEPGKPSIFMFACGWQYSPLTCKRGQAFIHLYPTKSVTTRYLQVQLVRWLDCPSFTLYQRFGRSCWEIHQIPHAKKENKCS